jgi:hypothetical protein
MPIAAQGAIPDSILPHNRSRAVPNERIFPGSFDNLHFDGSRQRLTQVFLDISRLDLRLA